MSTVMLVGAFGQGNPGDEALCDVFCAALADHEVIVASGDPGLNATRHGARTIPAAALPTARAVRAADVVVVGGGTIFKTLHPSTGRAPTALLRNVAALVAGARASGARAAMVGVGAGDLGRRSARALSRWIVSHVDLLILRDEESAAVLADAGARPPFWIGADATWALDAARPSPTPPGPRTRSMTIAISHLAGDLGGLAAAVRPWCDEWSVRLQPWQPGAAGRDLDAARLLRARLGGRVEIIDPPADLADASATFAADELVIGLRFHALVAAARAGTRFLAVAHEPKLVGLARRLGQVSVPAHATGDVFAGVIAHSLAHDPPSRSAVDAEIRDARRSLDLLRLLVNGGAVDDVSIPVDLAGLPLSSGGGTW
jgi:polysaccharide pyruvyl transferase WcaK-like protein